MKIDGLGVVLAIILLPILLVVTFYIQMQVDTIATENLYNSKLLSATYDAMAALEINTANEQLSTVADSMRSIILASNNVFLNSLATNLGISNASKEHLQPYIPAVLYTMYDGYYIYSPTETAKVLEKKENFEGSTELQKTTGYRYYGQDANIDHQIDDSENPIYGDIIYEKASGGYTVDRNKAKTETDYLLKSYVQYSARYQKGNKDVTINYTLDNYLNIIGKIGNIYYTKTGYLIKKDLVSEIKINGNRVTSGNEDDIRNQILGLKANATTTISAADSASVTVNGVEIVSNFATIKSGMPGIETISEAEDFLKRYYENYDQSLDANTLNTIQNLEYEIQNCKAVAYYASAKFFSDWVYENLSDLMYSDIQDSAVTDYYANANYQATSGAGESDLYYSFAGNDSKIFDNTEDPENPESKFNTHKLEVIKNSIKYNLNLSISAYCKMNTSYDFSMPVLLDEEWDKILSNISIVSFMQGWNCGLDIYNNYEIVSSTNNELTVTPSEIYYVKKSDFDNGIGNYHRIDCPYLEESADGYISFKSKEVKYDKVYDSEAGNYKYDHKNLACYTCINTNNYYERSLFDVSKNSYYDRIATLRKTESDSDRSEAKIKAGYIAIAEERQNIYKTNALPVSQGYRVLSGPFSSGFSLDLNDIKELQITFSDTKSEVTQNKEPILKLNVNIGSSSQEKSVILDQKKEQTITVDVSAIDGTQSVSFERVAPSYDVSYTIKSVKAIYK